MKLKSKATVKKSEDTRKSYISIDEVDDRLPDQLDVGSLVFFEWVVLLT